MIENKKVALVVLCHFTALLAVGYMSGCASKQYTGRVRPRIKDDFAGSQPYKRTTARYYHPRVTDQAELLSKPVRVSSPSVASYTNETEKNVGVAIHTVKKGETLYAISRKYGVHPKELARFNDLGNANLIRAGQKIRIPVNGKTVPSSSESTVIVKRTKPVQKKVVSRKKEINYKPITVSAEHRTTTYAIHTIKRGETIWQVAQKFDVTVDQICKTNNLTRDSLLTPGDKIKIPVN